MAPAGFNAGALIFEREANPFCTEMESDHEVGGANELEEWAASLPPPPTCKNAAMAELDAPSTPGHPPDTPTKNQKSRDKKKARRRVKRVVAAAESGSALKGCAKKHRSQAAAKSIKPDIDCQKHFEKMHTRPCWTALREKEQERQTYDLAGLQGLGMNLINWDGR